MEQLQLMLSSLSKSLISKAEPPSSSRLQEENSNGTTRGSRWDINLLIKITRFSAAAGRCVRLSLSRWTVAQVEEGENEDFWSRLPEDVKVDILCRLEEEKDIIGAKFVSKDWNFLISNVCVRIFSPPSPSAPFCGFLLFEEPPPEEEAGAGAGAIASSDLEKEKKKKLNLLFIAIGKYMARDFCQRVKLAQRISDLLPPKLEVSDIQHYCNGLLLLASSCHQNPIQYYVCNPATNQCIRIPINPNHQNREEYHSSLAFDPLNHYSNDCVCNYRIVHYIRGSAAAASAAAVLELELDVFCSETGEWTSHVVPLQPPPHNFVSRFPRVGFDWIRQTVYRDGILYYLTSFGYLVCINVNIPLTCWVVVLPDNAQQDTNYSMSERKEKEDQEFGGCIGISSGCFYYSNRYSQSRSTMLVWMLLVVDNGEASHSKWVLRHTINTGEMVEMIGTVPCDQGIKNNIESCWPCAFHPYNDQIIYMAAQQPRLFFTYRHRTKRVSMVHFPFFLRRTVLDQKLIFPYSRCLLPLIQT
ncbi:hypothetical protein ACH5RR_022572 [Cinchona calisaya]|uniref:F-box domain-containing protein n=1 Tax=Cinchona calisaya TaxID=153742 RepID=A0ABD2ZBJ9_9GENT